MLQATQILFWRIAALVALALGIAGTLLPVVPTVPFLIVAAWAGSKGWPALERWMLAHPTYGPYVRDWRERGIVPRRAKILATLMMATSGVALQFFDLPHWLKIGVPLTMLCVAIWLWRRPEA